MPFLSTLAYSERYAQEQGKRHKPLTEWAWQMLLQLRRWQPQREIVAVADAGYASLKLLDRCRRLLSKPVTFITRLRLDAALYEPAPPRKPGQMGRPRLKGERLANLSAMIEDPKMAWRQITVANWYGERERTADVISETAVWYSTGLPAVSVRWVLIREPQGQLEPQALLCTDLAAEPGRIVSWFVRRWQMEATFQEARQRLGFETQRHWSEMAIRRTAPALLGLFSLVTLFADGTQNPGYSQAGGVVLAGNALCRPADVANREHRSADGLIAQGSSDLDADALASVRKELWAQEETFCGSLAEAETV